MNYQGSKVVTCNPYLLSFNLYRYPLKVGPQLEVAHFSIFSLMCRKMSAITLKLATAYFLFISYFLIFSLLTPTTLEKGLSYLLHLSTK
jgi:hypothetical protein